MASLAPTQNTMLDATNIDQGVHFQCSVVGYQFPNTPDDDWCLVRITIRHGSSIFEKVDPAIEAQDLVKVRNWFRALAEFRLPRFARLTFIEPCLSFDFLASTEREVRFAVHLGAQLRPKFPLEQLGVVDKKWRIVFGLEPQQLGAVADATDVLCTKFPVRSRQT